MSDQPGSTTSGPPGQRIAALDVDGVAATVAGTVAWAIALGVLTIFFRPQLDQADALWWIWVCVVGVALGLLALPYLLKRRAAYRRHRERDMTDGD